MREVFRFFLLVAVALFLVSWGYNGHYKINYNAELSYNLEMSQFIAWTATLAAHASDADQRKSWDPEEGPKHYIDIDNYPGFYTTGRIPQTYDSVIALYGYNFVISQGILPWATMATYDSLVACFRRFDWSKAVLFAADLGHYVADGHMPLHITRNYNGQFTNNYGIHSRYESTMINTYLSQIVYSGDSITFVTDVNGYIFEYLYHSYTFVDSILAADTYAHAVAGNTSSSVYRQALWEKTKGFTIPLFRDASHALAELIHSAWVEAGKPDMNSGPGIFEFGAKTQSISVQVWPNPIRESSTIKFDLPREERVTFQVYSLQGALLGTIADMVLPDGMNEIIWKTDHYPSGTYILVVSTTEGRGYKKVIKL
jgi:hypothetical protein